MIPNDESAGRPFCRRDELAFQTFLALVQGTTAAGLLHRDKARLPEEAYKLVDGFLTFRSDKG
jgi:hypothetical protein